MGGDTKMALGSLQCMGYENTLAGATDIGEVGFKLVAYSREVSVDRFGVDVSGLKSDVKRQHLLSGFDVEAM